MIGIGSQGSVVSQIIADCEKYDMRSATKYDPRQIVQRVWFDKQTVASCRDNVPSYIWWSIELQEGELSPDVDLGKLPHEVTTGKLKDGRPTSRYVWPAGEMDHIGAWQLLTGHSDIGYTYHGKGNLALQWMLEHGLSIGQRVLTRMSGHYYRCSWEYDEWDVEIERDILYAEPLNDAIIPVTVDIGQLVAPRRFTKIIQIEGEEEPAIVMHERKARFYPAGVPKWFI